jgi:predicted AAA+ superfamily ATPase
MMWLEDMGVLHRVNRVTNVRHPIATYADERAFKVFGVDVGLVACQSGLDWSVLHHGDGVFGEFRGALAEQFVLNHLVANQGLRPFYWGSDTGRAEVDFLIEHTGQAIPIEVKSGSLRAKSLSVYINRYQPTTAIRLSPSDYKQSRTGDTATIDLPLYAISRLGRLVSSRIG